MSAISASARGAVEIPADERELGAEQPDAAVFDRKEPGQLLGFAPVAQDDQHAREAGAELFDAHVRPEFLVQHQRGVVHPGPFGLRCCLVTGLDHLINLTGLLEVKGGRRHGAVAPGPFAGPRMQVTPLVGTHLGVHLALHERVHEAHLAVRPFPHQPDLVRLVQCGYGVFGVAFHHVGDGGEVVGGVQHHRRRPQEVAGHVVRAGEPAPQDRVRAWQDDVPGQR